MMQTVTVVTAATGHQGLARAIRSVQAQTFGNLEHLIVADGTAREQKVREVLGTIGERRRPAQVVSIPHVTGADGWNGHRIYAAMSYLVNTEYVCFLDEDNWYEPNHVESLLHAVRQAKAVWGFSLRNLYDEDGKFIALDLCDSLGFLHPVFEDPNDYQVDTSCYMLRRDVAAMFASLWYRPTRQPNMLDEPDHLLCRTLMQQNVPGATNLMHSVNYTVGSQPGSVLASWFLTGNDGMRRRYPKALPWERRIAS